LWLQNQFGSFTQYGQSSYGVWILLAKWNLSYALETVFSLNLIATLTFDLVTPKSKGVFQRIWTIILWSMNSVVQMEFQLCSGNCFQFLSNSELDLWPCDPKINFGLLPNMDNHPMKFEYCGPNKTLVML
jgi:hypothetical protein